MGGVPLSLGVSGYAALSAPYFVFVDADLCDFDPRPALARSRSPLWQTAVHAGHDVNRALASGQRAAALSARDAAISLAALLMLLTTAPGDAR